ncbi:PEP-CTERM sorting domain-containing protein [Thalassotalea sp. PLHSN55]|uniref:PEP-CTERM sorting domain-containing protein n=1 Tax=Thalassotalea sp. PLHSN55 TaxID=3435888 RepID=UPI003F82A747
MKNLGKCLVALFMLASTQANAGIIFDFYWTGDMSEDSSITASFDNTLRATGTIEIDAVAGSSFSFADVVSTNISVTGDTITDFLVTSWSSIGGDVSLDGQSVSLTSAGNTFSVVGTNYFGCYWVGCGGSNPDNGLWAGQSGDQLVEYNSQASALAAYRITAPSSVPEPSSLLLIFAGLAGLGFNRRRKQ